MSELDPLEAARQLLADDLARFDAMLAQALAPQHDYLSETEHELYRRGKRLRPMLLLLCAHLGSPTEQALPDKVIRAAVSLEMLHVATLIHDDIVDAAATRRGLQTVYSARGTDMAILVGDLQFVQAVRCFADGVDTQTDMHLVRMILDVGFQICCGEIDELNTDPNWAIGALLRRYDRTIDRKTAALFGLACEAGMALVGARSRYTYAASRFGRSLGRAFQIMDDLIDLVVQKEVSGKQPGSDLRQRRLSLPIIYAMGELPQTHMLHQIVRGAVYTPDDLAHAIQAIVLSKGFFRSYSVARDAVFQGVAFLDGLPDNQYCHTLRRIAQFVVDHDLQRGSSEVR